MSKVAPCPSCHEVAVEITAQGDGWKEAQCGACARLWFINYTNERGR